MSEPKKIIEQVKNVSLVVLFFSTVLLLYFFWGNVSFDKISLPKEQIALEIPEVQDVVIPHDIIVNFGGENYTMIPWKNREIWNNNQADKFSIIKEFNKFGQTENIRIEEITPENYKEAMKSQSIQANFAYDIPFLEFCREHEINIPQSYNSISYITGIGYSAVNPESLFIRDGKENKNYRLYADADHTDFSALIAAIEAEGYNTYYPISSYLGIQNNTLVPLEIETNLRSFYFQQDVYLNQKEKINQFAETFFGTSFDFVRKITEDNGTIIYMYGYGQKVLIVKPNGTFEYKEEQPNNAESKQSYFESLESALEFVASHGTWKSLNGAKLTPYLKDVVISSDKKADYRFIFGMEVNGTRLFNEIGETIVVDVTRGQVTYYYRNILDFDQEEIESITASSYESAYSAVNLIAQNFGYIYNILREQGLETDELDKNKEFEKVSSLISSVEIGYLNSMPRSGETNKVKPVWVVGVSGINMYFDLYSAEPLAYAKK